MSSPPNAGTPPRVLLVECSNWPMAATLPRALHAAGLEVGTLSDPESILRRSCFSRERFVYSRHALRILTILRTVRRWKPDLVVPCDDEALVALVRIREEVARSRPWLVPRAVRDCIDRSLGRPADPRIRSSRLASLAALEAAGVRTAPFAAAPTADSAEAFADRTGYPIVLKTDGSAAGAGVRICRDRTELPRAFGELRASFAEVARPGALDRLLYGATRPGPAEITAQKFIAGQEAMHTFAALGGRALAGLSVEKVVRSNDGLGPSTVVRFLDHDGMAAAAHRFTEATGLAGFGSLDFMIDPEGVAWAIEFNARITAIVHLGEFAGVDVAAAVARALQGVERKPSAVRAGQLVALFPREWMRDPYSPYLRTCPVDAPIDDPEVLRALIERAESSRPGTERIRLDSLEIARIPALPDPAPAAPQLIGAGSRRRLEAESL